MRYRRLVCPAFFTLAFLVLAALPLGAVSEKLLEGPVTRLTLSNLVNFEEQVSPDGEVCVHFFAKNPCKDECKKLYLVISEKRGECGEKKRIIFEGTNISAPFIMWLDDNEMLFSYASGQIKKATGYKILFSYARFLKIEKIRGTVIAINVIKK